jgi:hypothetical protein
VNIDINRNQIRSPQLIIVAVNLTRENILYNKDYGLLERDAVLTGKYLLSPVRWNTKRFLFALKTGHETKKYCAGEGQQQFSSQPVSLLRVNS